ncbi:MAG: hypothetical protein WA814_08780 [Candidatus Baltobacteraceae bacterium]
MTRTITSAPELLTELLAIAIVVTCFVTLHAILQRRFKTDVLRRHNDVAGYLFSAVGVLYAVVLGFVVVVVWQKYDNTVSNVEAEVDAAGNLYHVADGFPEALRTQVRNDVRGYANEVIAVEWPLMARDQPARSNAASLLEDISYRTNTFSPSNARESVIQQAAIRDLELLFDARRQRLVQAVPEVPFVLWFALVAGALAMVAFCYIFGVENRPTQLVMTAILVGLIAILFVVIQEFATPFSGSVSISPDGWVFLRDRLSSIR